MSNVPNNIRFDMLAPPEMAEKTAQAGLKKAQMDILSMFLLSMLAGIFISLGANFYTIVMTGSSSLPFGIARLIGGLVFCLGLVLVIVAGAELFTGNNLIVMAVASRKVAMRYLLRSWAIVYVGNFVGSLATVWLIRQTGQDGFGSGQVGQLAVKIAAAKCSLDFWPAFCRGVLCNALVCWAIWLCFSARSATDKIMAIIFPITAFVAGGFEHCVANMYFIPMGLALKPTAILGGPASLTWRNFFVKNLIPVTLGNIVGGTILVGLVFWVIYSRRERKYRSHMMPPGKQTPRT